MSDFHKVFYVLAAVVFLIVSHAPANKERVIGVDIFVNTRLVALGLFFAMLGFIAQ